MRMLLVVFFVFSSKADANCTGSFSNDIYSEVVPSGRDHDLIEQYKQDAQRIFGKGGIAEKLGLSITPHVAEFVPSTELSLLAVNGRHALGHWKDGEKIVKGALGSMGVLEFVTPGCPTCRSFYMDTTPYIHQLSVMMHVAGHNDFAVNSFYNQIRNSDPIAESLNLFHLMEQLSQHHDPEEVALWYQLLLSASNLQDFPNGTFDDPATFKQSDTTYQPGEKHKVRAPSASVLQSMVENLPHGTPSWKKKMLVHFERMERVYPYVASTKIMNEGWATLMMEMLPAYSPWKHSRHAIEYADLFGAVARPGLTNPYWLGREAWRAVRARFNSRPEINALEQLERDTRFVAYAHELIGQMNDFDFIRFALDERWVHKHNLVLKREVTPEEYDSNLPPPRDPTHRTQHIVVSRDPRKVIDFIANAVANKAMHYPRITLVDLHGLGRNVVELRHEYVRNRPLDLREGVQALYVLSQIYQRPVSLETRAFHKDSEDAYTSIAVRLEVDVNGTFSLNRLEDGEVENPALGEQLEKTELSLSNAVQEMVEEIAVDEDPQDPDQFKLFIKSSESVVDRTIDPAVRMVSHSPTSGRAIQEYVRFVEHRLAKALEEVVKGKRSYKLVGNAVRFKALPKIPAIKFDESLAQKLEDLEAPYPLDINASLRQSGRTHTLAVDIGSSKGLPGERHWGPKPEDGQGQGDRGEEEGEPGDDPGEGAGDSADGMIEIPFEYFAELLETVVKLPNTKPRGGGGDLHDTIKEGGARRPSGEILYERMAGDALALGYKLLADKGIENPLPNEAMSEGFKYLPEQNYVVKDRSKVPGPSVKAVVVFARDMSGSMHGEPNRMATEFFYHMKGLLAHRYDDIEFRFVGFSTVAEEFKEQEYLTSFLNGGTDYGVGLSKSMEILGEYSKNDYDRYLFTLGDFDDFGSSAAATLVPEIAEQLQYSGYVMTTVYDYQSELSEQIKALTSESKYVGYAKIDPDNSSYIGALKDLFNKNEESD